MVNITDYLPLVRREATWAAATRFLPGSLSLDDLIGAGSLGLVVAADRWVPDKTEVEFRVYARKYIRGAIYREYSNEIRQCGHRDRSCAWPHTVPEDVVDNPFYIGNEVRVNRELLCEADYLLQEEVIDLETALPLLKPRQRLIIEWYYKDELSLAEIAKRLKLKNSTTISTMKRKAIMELRKIRGESSNGIKHGTLNGYRYCRCDKCKQAKSESNHQQFLNKKVA
jgi:RNA polymerase sigma factor (sigma-70 family)